MDAHIKSLLNKTTVISAAIATVILLSILLRPPSTCLPHSSAPHRRHHHHIQFPSSTCELRHRHFTTADKYNRRLWSTSAWLHQVHSYSLLFLHSQRHSLLSNSSRCLCLLAGAGHEVMALGQIGVADVTGVDLVDSPPLVHKADPYNLPFFDEAFDFAFSVQYDIALFPSRFVSEMERTVRVGGICLLLVEKCTDAEVKEIVKQFKRGKLVEAGNWGFGGSNLTRIVVYREKWTKNAVD